MSTNYLSPSLSREQKIAVEAWRIIRDNPKSWDQSTWRASATTQCGAKLCWGGHVTLLDLSLIHI